MDHCRDFVKARDLDKQQLLNQIQIGDIGFTPQAPNFGAQSSLPSPGIFYPNQTSQFQQHPFNYNNQANSQPQQYYQNPHSNQLQQPPQLPQRQQPGTWNPNQQPYPHQMLPGTWSPNPMPPNAYMPPPE